jgi:hypothetical protein
MACNARAVCFLVHRRPALQAQLRPPDLPGKEAVELILRYPLITDLASDMGWIDCLQERPREYERERDRGEELREPVASEYAAAPIRRSAPKVGRNEPCPCGSGKKFKKCCGAG